MSEDTTSSHVENRSQADEEQDLTINVNDKTDNKATSEILESENFDKTPMTSATNFNEDFENKNKNTSVLIDESLENVEPRGFNETECVRFAEKLYKIVEELRIGRLSEKENELRIQNLMSEKNNLERLKDDEALKNQELIKKHSMQQHEEKKQFDDKLRCFQEEKRKHALERESGEQEIKALKDEIRSLHINKYRMEKIIKDQERQIQNHGTSNSNYLTHLAKVENQCKDIFKQCSQVLNTVDKVEANINSSKKLNKKLSFINNHQNCILLTMKEKNEKMKQDLISLQAKNVSSSVEGENENNTEESTAHLEDELRMQKELCQQVQEQLNDSRQEIQELLKSLDNAHSLLAKHVDTNNKYAETETLLQLELDDARTACEKYKDELKVEKNSVQEKDEELKEIKNKMEEKEKQLQEQVGQLTKDNEVLQKEKESLEELSSMWSQKIVEQKEEIESSKEKMSEMETSMEDTKQQLKEKSSDVEPLEEKLKAEARRYESLLQNAEEEKTKNSEEAIKWRERTTELLKQEKNMKSELDKVKEENKVKEPQNKCTQTEVVEKANKETNTEVDTCSLSKEMNSITVNKNTLQNHISSEIRNGKDKMTLPHSEDNLLQISPTKYNTVEQHKHQKTISISTETNIHSEINNETETSAVINNNNNRNLKPMESQTFTASIANSHQDPPSKTTDSSPVPNIGSSTTCVPSPSKQIRLETPESKKESIEKLESDERISLAISIDDQNSKILEASNLAKGNRQLQPTDEISLPTTTDHNKNFASGKPKAKQDSLTGNTNEFFTSQKAQEISENILSSSKDEDLKSTAIQSETVTTQNGKESLQSGSAIAPNRSVFEENNISLSNQNLELPSQNCFTKSQQTLQIKLSTSRGKTGNILGNKTPEKRKPLLAVVKPSSAGLSNTSNQPRATEAIATAIGSISTSESPCQFPNGSILLESVNHKPLKEGSEAEESVSNLTKVSPTRSTNLKSDYTSSQTRAKVMAEISKDITTDSRISQSSKPMLKLSSSTGLGNITDTEMIQQASETQQPRPHGTIIPASKQTPSLEKPSEESNTFSQKSKSEETTHIQNESMQACNSMSEDFCFSDEEDESIPRAIGNQVDRIETFLKNERLRLSKKRKAPDE